MSHGIRRVPQIKALESARRAAPRIRSWCEQVALLTALALALVRLRSEIGSWQTLLLTAVGAPLALFDGRWSPRPFLDRLRQRLRRPLSGVPQQHHLRLPVSMLINCTPDGHDIVISTTTTDGPEAVTTSARQEITPQVLTEVARVGPAGPVHESVHESVHEVMRRPAYSTLPVPPVPLIGQSQHCILFAVDIVQFTDARRDDEVQLALRDALYRLLVESFEGSGISWESCIHEDRGDGVVVVIPANMPTIVVVDMLVEQIRARLRRHNRMASAVAQIRLRLAAHIGEVYRDSHGLVGEAVNHLFRILDAPALRGTIQHRESPLALIVSDYLYRSVIRGGPTMTHRAAYCPVTVRVKQFQARAWLLGEAVGD